jgi:hypothetical protein
LEFDSSSKAPLILGMDSRIQQEAFTYLFNENNLFIESTNEMFEYQEPTHCESQRGVILQQSQRQHASLIVD